MRCVACGRMTRHITCRGIMPMARAACHWPRSMDMMPPRKISAEKAPIYRVRPSPAASQAGMEMRVTTGNA